MDNLTHTLVGAALGEAGLKRRSAMATAALLIGANLPDLDVIAIPFGESLTFRRGWTHGPLAMLVLPALLTLVLVLWDRVRHPRGRRPPGRAPMRPGMLLLVSYAAVLSHPALDWLNTYGIRLLMPFSERWFYGDTIFIIDPWIWLALGLGVAVSRRRLRARHRPAPAAARLALAAVAAYVGLMMLGSRAAHDLAERHVLTAERRAPARVMAGPVPLNPFRRALIVDMGEHYRFGSVAWRPAPVVALDGAPLPTNAAHPAARAALARPEVRDFLYWSRFPFFQVDGEGGEAVVRVGDARFVGRSLGFGVTVRVPTPSAANRP